MLDELVLSNLIMDGHSIRSISRELNMGYSTIRYYLKKYNLSTINKKTVQLSEKVCPRCGELKSISLFYSSFRSGKKKYGYCKNCSNDYASERIRNVKIKMIEYKGGICTKCNLALENSNYFVFDFHHLDPDKKDPNFKRIKFQKWDKIKKELDKCILVCSNCHRTIHFLQTKDME